MARTLALVLAVGMLLGPTLGSIARADNDPTPELNAERDALLDKIARGVDYDASVRRFAALVLERDGVVATSYAAEEQLRKQRETERSERAARRTWEEAYRKTADYEVSWRCTLSPDPAHPIPSREGRFRPDWGKVVRKQQLRLPPKNELDDGEPATMYEVAGVAGHYQFRGDRFDPWRKPFDAKVGDLVLVCDGGEDTPRWAPPGWGPRLVTSGFAVRIARPPLIVRKARFAPIHVTGSAFFWMIHDVKWSYPPDANLLSNLVIDKDLGGGRYQIAADNGLSWILEAPPGLAHRALLVPGHAVWVILGRHRFDRALKKLVLVALDVEDRYILTP